MDTRKMVPTMLPAIAASDPHAKQPGICKVSNIAFPLLEFQTRFVRLPPSAGSGEMPPLLGRFPHKHGVSSFDPF